MKINRTPIVVALAAAFTLTATALVAVAQGPGGPGGGRPGGGGGGGRMGGGGGRGGGMRMYEQLGLKPEQKTKIEALVKKHREQSMALRKKQTDEIKAILTPEQRKKLDQQMEQMRQRFGGGPGGGGPGGPGGGRPGGGGGR
ncbi:MAG: hypothetical protein QM758_07705 [Armatimonas sp.]